MIFLRIFLLATVLALPAGPRKVIPTPGPGFLVADGADEKTYELIRACGFNYETPDASGDHAQAPWRHIRQRVDPVLGRPVFDFYLHIQNDDDRGKASVRDRQRNEIKTDGHSPADLVAQKGETLRMSWLFRLPAGMQTTNRFAHIHQLKGLDNKEGTADVGHPVITFTVRTLSNGKQQFQIIHTTPTDQGKENTTLARADLGEFLGAWVKVTETVTFDEKGSYSVLIERVSDGVTLVDLRGQKLWMWAKDCTGMRPKWGLYRNFGKNRDLAHLLRDEVLSFADFHVEKISGAKK